MSQMKATPSPTTARYRIVIEHLWNNQTRLTAPIGTADMRKLCLAMMQDAAKIIEGYQAQSEAQEKGEPAIIVPEKQLILPGS